MVFLMNKKVTKTDMATDIRYLKYPAHHYLLHFVWQQEIFVTEKIYNTILIQIP